MSTELRTQTLQYLLEDIMDRQLGERPGSEHAEALASVAADLRNLLAGKSPACPIDWSRAPDWAQWLAMDAEGEWYWYELEPQRGGREWVCNSGRADPTFPLSWRETLHQRPEAGQ